MMERMAPETRIEEATAAALQIGRAMSHLPDVLDRAERTARLLAEAVDEDGLRLHPSSTEAIARERNRNGYERPLLWLVLGAIGALLLTRFF